MVRLATVWLLLATVAAAADKTVQVTVEAGKLDRTNSPVARLLPLSKELEKRSQVVVKGEDGTVLPGQITRPNLMVAHTPAVQEGEFMGELHFVVPKLVAGKSAT